MEETTTRGQVSRRTIAKGMAWAAPAIPVVAMAPKAAASVCVPTLGFSDDSCRCTGVGQNDKDYYVSICNTGVTCPDSDGVLYVAIRAATGSVPRDLLYNQAIAVDVGECSEPVYFTSGNSSSNLQLHYGATAAEALADSNTTNYVTVDAPNDCNDLPEDERLGSCNQG